MDLWLCLLIADRSSGVHVDFAGAGPFDDLYRAVAANTRDVWDHWYSHAVFVTFDGPVFAAGDEARDARWYRAVTVDGVPGLRLDEAPPPPALAHVTPTELLQGLQVKLPRAVRACRGVRA